MRNRNAQGPVVEPDRTITTVVVNAKVQPIHPRWLKQTDGELMLNRKFFLSISREFTPRKTLGHFNCLQKWGVAW